MANSVESRAKRVVSELDALDVIERAVDLIEYESPCVGCAVAQKPRFRVHTRTIAWAALLVGLFVPPILPLDEIIGIATAFRGPAMGLHEATVMTSTIKVGEPLIVKTKNQYLRMCAWRWTHEWLTQDGRPISLSWQPGVAHVIGAIVENELAFALPTGIKPGSYILRVSATGECGHGDIAQIAPQELAFTVTD